MIATVEPDGVLCGSLSCEAALSGSIAATGTLSGSVSTSQTLCGSLSMPGSFERYEGGYTVIPAVAAKSLSTKDKLMQDDVTVTAIPYYEVSNPQGGSTIVIGDDHVY